jgi:hypothetical protein
MRNKLKREDLIEDAEGLIRGNGAESRGNCARHNSEFPHATPAKVAAKEPRKYGSVICRGRDREPTANRPRPRRGLRRQATGDRRRVTAEARPVWDRPLSTDSCLLCPAAPTSRLIAGAIVGTRWGTARDKRGPRAGQVREIGREVSGAHIGKREEICAVISACAKSRRSQRRTAFKYVARPCGKAATKIPRDPCDVTRGKVPKAFATPSGDRRQ